MPFCFWTEEAALKERLHSVFVWKDSPGPQLRFFTLPLNHLRFLHGCCEWSSIYSIIFAQSYQERKRFLQFAERLVWNFTSWINSFNNNRQNDTLVLHQTPYPLESHRRLKKRFWRSFQTPCLALMDWRLRHWRRRWQQRWSRSRSGLRSESTIFAGDGPGVGISNKNWTRSRSEIFSFYSSRIIVFIKFKFSVTG